MNDQPPSPQDNHDAVLERLSKIHILVAEVDEVIDNPTHVGHGLVEASLTAAREVDRISTELLAAYIAPS